MSVRAATPAAALAVLQRYARAGYIAATVQTRAGQAIAIEALKELAARRRPGGPPTLPPQD
ncbi:hypothetical protein [Hansschlegelia sp.]|uniref:hypothetical protein n=1 Tax=Hansschlegelia sp. TaxID=2041892 RepID=UPI002B8F331F|nr:hypothetical protein [Hansschlegelia sp.]HVI28362.1 hypothetical protein [Hansschlegelia sp.]